MYRILKNYIALSLIFLAIDFFTIKNHSMFNVFGYIPTVYSLTQSYWIVIIPILYIITKYMYLREIDKDNNFDIYIEKEKKIKLILIIFNILTGFFYIIFFNNTGYALMYMIISIGYIFLLKSKKERFKKLSTIEIKKFKEKQKKEH